MLFKIDWQHNYKGEISNNVKYKERIAFATMRASIPDWQPPSNWNSLTNKQKLNRLDKLQSV